MPQTHPWKHKANPWEPVDYHNEEGDTAPVVYAVRALVAGKANDGQQKLFVDWLAHVCAADDWAFRPGEQRGTDIMLGRQFVWGQVRKMLHPATTPKPKANGHTTGVNPAAVKRPRGRPRKVKNA